MHTFLLISMIFHHVSTTIVCFSFHRVAPAADSAAADKRGLLIGRRSRTFPIE